MRATLADLQRALLEARTALGRCTELQQALAAAPNAATAAPKASPGDTQATRTMVMVQTAFDPAKLSCSPKIDPKAAVNTTYQGKTYFFCSAKDRDEFLKNPAMSVSMMPPPKQ